MMPKPNPNKRRDNRNGNNVGSRINEKVLLETKPNFWLYSDNFLLKIVVLFLLVFMFAPIMTFVYTLQGEIVTNFHIVIDNLMFYTELFLFLIILVIVIKLILDVLDWNYTEYVFTDSRIIIQRGFIRKEKIMMSYNKIQDIEIKQSLLERVMRVGDIIIYGANEVSETILDDIPSPRDVEEIIINRMNAIGFANQNTYMNNSYQQPNYNPQYQQPNPHYQQQYPNQQYYQQDQGYIQPDHNQTYNYRENNYIPQEYNKNSHYDEDVIIPEQSSQEQWIDRNTGSSKELDKEQILRKHDEMFKRHKK